MISHFKPDRMAHSVTMSNALNEMPGLSRLDARYFQIVSLTGLLIVGLWGLHFDQKPAAFLMIASAALLTQAVCTWVFGLPRFDPLSPLITSLSLTILLRADQPAFLVLAAVMAMASKFLIRSRGKHIFNPANFAITALILTGQAWISPAQWGSTTWLAFLIASLAGLVLSRAKRADIALAFLGTYVALLFLRAFYLGDPIAIPVKQMQSGAVLLFAFFMISDPKTVPDRRCMRILFAVLVAALAHYLVFWRYRPEGLMYALFFLTPLVPVLDRLKPVLLEMRFTWARPTL